MTFTRDTYALRNACVVDDDVDNNNEHEEYTTKDTVIVHPLSLYNSACSPTLYRGYDWTLQRHEMQQLLKEQQQHQKVEEQPEEQPLALFDYTCEENLRAIFGYLDGASLNAARRTCRYFYELGANDEFWYHLCRAECAISPEQLRQTPESYQALYKFASLTLKRMIREYFQQHCIATMQKTLRIPHAMPSYAMY